MIPEAETDLDGREIIHNGTPWWFDLLAPANQQAFIDRALDTAWAWRDDMTLPGDHVGGPPVVIGTII